MNDEFARYGAVPKTSNNPYINISKQMNQRRYQQFEPASAGFEGNGNKPRAGPVKVYDQRVIGSAKHSVQSASNDVMSTNPSSQAAHTNMSVTCDAAGFHHKQIGNKTSVLRMSGGLEPIKEAKQLKSG